MNSSTLLASTTQSLSVQPSPSAILDTLPADPVPAHHANPVVAFIIGLAIVILASILNAAGLNLTKLDHVRTSAIPKASRRKDWLRPLWLLGMILYILSQLIGSTLALEYMRAEYVAPLGSTSLIFNFLFAKFLVDSPVTYSDIYGTTIVIIGVIGIVAFGSINSGLDQETNAERLTYLWRRGNWLGYFFFMAFSLIFVLIFLTQLDAVLASRSDLSSIPFSSMRGAQQSRPPAVGWFRKIKDGWQRMMLRIGEYLEHWTASHDDKRVAWTLGIGWACCGGGLAGGCLVYAKASVKLISGTLSHENTGNQFGHASAIFTFILLAITAVLQIICLNRGLKVYDSTLVVPVFYGVYTATGFLDSLIFNDEVDAYASWTLFLIFVSILILVSGVVLLTHKKPDNHAAHTSSGAPATNSAPLASISPRKRRGTKAQGTRGDEEEALRDTEGEGAEDGGVFWQVGDVSDDEDSDERVRPNSPLLRRGEPGGVGERARMIGDMDEDEREHRASTSSDATLTRPDGEEGATAYQDEEFGGWEDGKTSS